MVIAIDGTAGVGKGTLARGLANALRLVVLDTGLLYRAVAQEMVKRSFDLKDAHLSASVARELDLRALEHPDLRTAQVALWASKVSSYPEVREALVAFQRNFAYNPPEGYAGSVLDGRDIGTFICPDAKVKFFLTADLNRRVQRRYAELQEKKEEIVFEDLFAQMDLRDRQDANRIAAPLKAAEDAYLLDTTFLNKEEVLQEALAVVRAKL